MAAEYEETTAETVPVRVVCRVRPQNEQEKERAETVVISCAKSKVLVQNSIGRAAGSTVNLNKSYSYDSVYGQYAKQRDIFNECVLPTIEEVMQGYSATVFAYGQTGTGKTFTMEGDFEKEEHMGIIPRSINTIFDRLLDRQSREGEGEFEFSVRISFLEVYNEQLTDLLAAGQDDIPDEVSPAAAVGGAGGAPTRFSGRAGRVSKGRPPTERLKIVEDSRRGVKVQNLEEVLVHDAGEVFEQVKRALKKRQVAETKCNSFSSRSHGIFTIMIHSKEKTIEGEDLIRVGKLHLVDLAGSECVGRSGATDRRLREAGNINQSLLTLGRVITALVENQPHVPYRDSKLTRLLRDSLGGRTKTTIIATLSPSSGSIEETLSTLDYALRARSIKNCPEANQRMTKRQLLRDFSTEIDHLRTMLHAAREKSGVHLPAEEYERLLAAKNSAEAQLAELTELHAAHEEELDALRSSLADVEAALAESRAAHAAAEEKLEETEAKLGDVEKELEGAKLNWEGDRTVLVARREVEEDLKRQGECLKRELRQNVHDAAGLRAKIERQRAGRAKLAHAATTALKAANEDAERTATTFLGWSKEQKAVCENETERVRAFVDKSSKDVEEMRAFVAEAKGRVSEFLGRFDDNQAEGVRDMESVGDEVTKDFEGEMAKAKDGAASQLAKITATLDALASFCDDHVRRSCEFATTQAEKAETFAQRIESFANRHGAAVSALGQTATAALEHAASALRESEQSFAEWSRLETAESDTYAEELRAALETAIVTARQRSDARRESLLAAHTSAASSAASAAKKQAAQTSTSTKKCETALTTNFAESFITDLRDVASTALATAEHDETALETLATHRSETTSAISSSESSFQTSFAALSKSLDHSTTRFLSAHTASSKTLATTTTSFTDTIKSSLSSLDTSITTHFDSTAPTFATAIQTSISSLDTSFTNAHSTIFQPFAAALNTRFQTFSTTEAPSPSPTGQTPAKRDIYVPRTFAATSPEDRILERFHSRKQRIEDPAITPTIARSTAARSLVNLHTPLRTPKQASPTSKTPQQDDDFLPPHEEEHESTSSTSPKQHFSETASVASSTTSIAKTPLLASSSSAHAPTPKAAEPPSAKSSSLRSLIRRSNESSASKATFATTNSRQSSPVPSPEADRENKIPPPPPKPAALKARRKAKTEPESAEEPKLTRRRRTRRAAAKPALSTTIEN